MPIYKYKCTKCNKISTKFQRATSGQSTTCLYCGGVAKQIIGDTSFVLKGKGFYKNDYKKEKE